MKARRLLLGIVGVALLVSPAAAQEDPALWPEPQRAFLQDGPGLLLTADQRRELYSLDEAGRAAFIERFLADPLPSTPANELAEAIERRSRLAFADLPPGDARAQLVFLLGPPTDKLIVDCGSTFRPLEFWTYGAPPAGRRFPLYQPSADEPFRVWLPIDSKEALYTREMADWMEQWESLGMGGKRIDRRFCPISEQVDALTGTDGLRGRSEAFEAREESAHRWVRPEDRASVLARPADLAAWAREAAQTRVGPEPERLAVETLDIDFPARQDQRLVSRVLLGVRPAPAEDGKAKLIVEGTFEREGSAFDEVRMRYRLPVPEEGRPVALLLERPLRPGQSFVLRLRIRDEVSGAESRLARGFRVPSKPESRLAPGAALAAGLGEAAPLSLGGRNSVLLVPPIDEVILGTWRAEALVTGDRVAKVTFLVDGEAQLSRVRPPYSAEVRLAPFPREQVVGVEAFDEAGELLSADQVVINQTRGAFRVAIAEPAPGAKIGRRALVRTELSVPEEQRVESVELRVNDRTVATLASPPWQAEIDVPDEEIVHLVAVARLDDGRTTEAVRFLRAPENLEQIEVNLVELFAAVTDSGGPLIRGLTQEDFQVFEEGRPQAISRFELVENLPLTLGFAIDTSVSMASSLVEAQRAADGFLRKLSARDRAFGVGFSSRPYLLIPPTDDLEIVSESLEGLRAAGRTAFYDGLITGLYYFRGYRGQRALIVLTDGEDTSSNTPWEQALEYARRSGVAVYPIGLNVSALKLEVRNQLQSLAEATGARAFFVEHAGELSGVYGEIERELRSRYYLAYQSERPADEYGYRPIEVKARRGKVRTARGYHP